MPELAATRTVSASIARAPQEVHAFVVDPLNLPQWVPSFAVSVRQEAGQWTVQTPDGSSATITFVAPNDLGVADHQVVLTDGPTVFNPLRVIPNRGGSEVLFTLVQEDEQSDAAFDELAGVVQRDLDLLKGLLER